VRVWCEKWVKSMFTSTPYPLIIIISPSLSWLDNSVMNICLSPPWSCHMSCYHDSRGVIGVICISLEAVMFVWTCAVLFCRRFSTAQWKLGICSRNNKPRDFTKIKGCWLDIKQQQQYGSVL